MFAKIYINLTRASFVIGRYYYDFENVLIIVGSLVIQA